MKQDGTFLHTHILHYLAGVIVLWYILNTAWVMSNPVRLIQL